MSIVDRLVHAWDAFKGRDPTEVPKDLGYSYLSRPDRARFSGGNEGTLIAAVLNKIAMDCATIKLEHCRLDEQDKYLETIDSSLNECLQVSANIKNIERVQNWCLENNMKK